MAQLDSETLLQLTRLCRIECTEEEQASLLNDLREMLAYFEQLQQLDTEGIPPCHHVVESSRNVMREDDVGEVLDREAFLANAPHIGGMIRVPSVIKQR